MHPHDRSELSPEDPKKTPASHHAHDVDDVLQVFATELRGLTQREAEARLKSHGPNRLPEPEQQSPWLRFLAQFNNVLIYVLLGSAVITAALGHLTDTAVILAVVIANAVIGFIQEGRAEQAMGAIRQMLSPHTAVLRDNKRISIDSADVVPGDVVLLEAGDRVPADLRLTDVSGLRIEEAILTGESVPVEKAVQPVDRDAALGDRTSMAFSGTLVAAGTGRGIVVATGIDTEIGHISGMLSGVELLTTPLVEQMDAFARWLTVLILLIAAVVFAYGYFVGNMPFGELFMTVVGLSVAAIPEGLPAVLTITLALGVQAMAQRNAIVRRLPAIETIGSVSVICTDKTGTLTRNEMMVASIATSDHICSVSGTGYAPQGSVRFQHAGANPDEHQVLVDIARASALCNDAALHAQGRGWRVEGDPMEGALHALARKIIGTNQEPFVSWSRNDTIPFASQTRYMATLHHDHTGHSEIHVKGAPEQVFSMCASQRTRSGEDVPLDVDYWSAQVQALASQGQRVLALAVRPVLQDHLVLNASDVEGELVLLGLLGLIDPPRGEAIDAVAECDGAGIRVKMITGDHAGTASAIARHIGLRNPDNVLTGADIDKLGDAELAASVVDTDVFARTSPAHKLRLVTALQSRGLTVAMTGDGVNDAPALKRADAGIAMGRKGSEAAKEAAEVVLADDNFASIVAAVREGRTVYDNIKKVITWTLPTNAGEAATIIVALFLGLALPITAVQILWINLVTACTLGLALAFEPTEADTMKRPPRDRHEPLLNGHLVWHIVFVSTLFLAAVFGVFAYAIERGYSIELARTLAVNMLVILEIFHLFFVRNIHGTSLTWGAVRGTPFVWACVGGVVVAQFAITYLPPLQAVFQTAAVPFLDGLLLIIIGVVFFAIVEAEKQLRLALRSQYAET
ncbi:MAG: cation-transporting P-type ATPase [Filomicrobium sp.]